MHMINSLLASALLVAAAVAQNISFTSFPEDVQAGEPVTITWTGGKDEPVTLTLLKGLSTDLKDVKTLTTVGRGGSFTWTPESAIVDGDDYALKITQGEDINYTNQFEISGGSETAPSTTAPTASASASATPSPSSSPSNSRNSTTSATTMTTGVTVTPSGPTAAPPTTAPPSATPSGSTGSIVAVSSPLAFIVGVLAAFSYLQ